MMENDKTSNPQYKEGLNKRINIFIAVSVFISLIIIGRLFYLQIIQGTNWRQVGEDQYFKELGDNFDRGGIYFDNKNNTISPAVEMFNKYDLAIDPETLKSNFNNKLEKDNSKTLTELQDDLYNGLQNAFIKYSKKNNEVDGNVSSSSLNFIDKDTFQNKLNKEDSAYEVLMVDIPEEIAEQIESLNYRGVIVQTKKSRVYYEKSIGAKVLGFVGSLGNIKTGLYGLEKFYNDVLEKSGVSNSNFFAEVFSDLNLSLDQLKEKSYLNNTKKEGDLNLTIDTNVEKYLNNILQETINQWHSEKIGGIIMDINNGSILGMDELPSFDPNNYGDVADYSVYKNDLVSGVYEMGSIIKPLTVAAALDSKTVTENTTYNDAGTISLDGYKISNYDKRARGPNTPLQQILSQSLNVGIAFLVEKMGTNILSDYFHRYGLGEYTGIDLPSEAEGLVGNLDSGVMVDSVTAGFGQGIAITPIQTIRALASLGNGGYLVTPHIVKSINYDNGDVKTIVTDTSPEVFDSTTTSERITKLLINVVDQAMHVKNPKYTIAAKTGTAQMVDPATGKYYSDRYLHSFFGYFPATNPKYIIFLYQVYPKGALYASETLKSAFFDLINYLATYYEVRPDRQDLVNF